MGEIFDGNFDGILVKANEVYQKHKITKGESWKDCNITELREKLREEFEEWEPFTPESFKDSEYKELLDIINVALMLAKRTKKV